MKKRAAPAYSSALILVFFLFGLFLYAAGCKTTEEASENQGEKMKLTSSFMSGDMMPADFTCDGDGSSPPLMINGAPSNAKSLALIVEDPDAPAGTFTHWIVWNISVNTTNIPRGGIPGEQGTNDFGKIGYGAPCPPSGVHHYTFRLLALDNKLSLPASAKRRDFDKVLGGHILSQAVLVGLYSRS